MSQHRDTDYLFKTHLGEHEIAPPLNIWDNIELNLDKQKKKKIIPIWVTSVAAMLSLTIGLLSWLINSTTNTNTNKKQHTQVQTTHSNTNIYNNTNSNTHINTSKNVSKNETRITQSKPHIRITNKNNNIHKNNLTYIKPLYHLINTHWVNTPKKIYQHTNSTKDIYISANYISTNESYKKNIKRDLNWSITALFSPEFSNNSVSNTSNTQQLTESGINAISGGLNFRVKTKKRWSFESGLFVTNTGQNISGQTNTTIPYQIAMDKVIPFEESNTVNIPNNSLGSISFNNTPLPEINMDYLLHRSPTINEDGNNVYLYSSNIDIKQQLQYIEIPLAARFNIIEKKTILSVSAGLCSNFLINNKATLLQDGVNVAESTTKDIKDFNYSSKFSIGIEYPVLKNISINVEPVFRYFMSSINESSNQNFQPYSYSFNAGLTYHFY
ncbi:MAG: hypothetical protein JW717_03510 [Marinilabiliaceae bacterium]|nr:hypothetical protein [Marinilabiliaceae bacterium]